MRWIGFIRNVMIGRAGLHREILLDACRTAGGEDPMSYLATGNLAFTAEDLATVLRPLEAAIAGVVGRPTPVMVRELPWLVGLIERAPLSAYDDSWQTEISFLAHDAAPLGDLPAQLGGTALIRIGPRELGTARPRDKPRAPHANPLLEKLSGQRGSARAWSTLARIAEREQARR